MKKNLYLFLLLCLAAPSLRAQIQRGEVQLSAAQPLLTGTNLSFVPDDRLGGLVSIDGGAPLYLLLTPNVAYAVTDRLTLGAEAALAVDGFVEGPAAILLPYLRYYPLNRPTVSVFAELGRTVVLADDDLGYPGAFRLAAGAQFPLGTGALITSSLQYTLRDEAVNQLALTAGLALRLGRNDRTGNGDRLFGDARWAVSLSDVQLSFLSVRSTDIIEQSSTLGLICYFSPNFALSYLASGRRNRTNFGNVEINQIFAETLLGARGYFTRRGRLQPFAEAGFGLGLRLLETSSNDFPDFNQDEVSANFLVYGRIGVDYFLRPNLALVAGLNVRRDFGDADVTVAGLSFGGRYFLGRSLRETTASRTDGRNSLPRR